MATTLLKPGGYQRLTQMAKLLDKENAPFEKIDVEAAGKLAKEAVKDPHHVKAMKPLPSRKMKKVPLMDCFVAPCKEDARSIRISQRICSLWEKKSMRKQWK